MFAKKIIQVNLTEIFKKINLFAIFNSLPFPKLNFFFRQIDLELYFWRFIQRIKLRPDDFRLHRRISGTSSQFILTEG